MEQSTLSNVWPGVAATLGVLSLVAGLLLPAMSDPAQAITEEQAKTYYEASAAVEQAAANQSRRSRDKAAPSSAEQAHELEAARARFIEAKQQIESAKEGKKSLASWLKIGGFVFVLLGAGGLFLQKSGG